MIKAKDIMTKELITISPDTEISHVAKLLLEHHLNGLPVVDENGKLKGIVCQSDLIVQQKQFPIPSVFSLLGGAISLTSMKSIEKEVQKIAASTVKNIMTIDPVTVESETSMEEIASLMVKHNIHTLPVVDEGSLKGIIGKEDILRTLMSSNEKS